MNYQKKVLLIEPGYKNKYPPLGLMKIAQYHNIKGDKVIFYKGLSPKLRKEKWDRIYITTLFTFYWNKTIKTIKYYKDSVNDLSNIYVGGVMATLLAKDVEKETGIKPTKGLLDKPGMLGYNDNIIVDTLVPDYSILEQIDYKYPVDNAYFGYMTRGCPRHCEFCAVRILEPHFKSYVTIKEQIKKIDKWYGPKKDLLLLDNNVLASKDFYKIIDEIKELGFEKGATFKGKKRYIDFNQGLDGRLLTREKAKKLSEIAINPVRIAFDDIKYKDIYKRAIRLVAEVGLKNLSNYILFNFKDTPEDFYRRLQINIELNEEFERKEYKARIWSFPMKYVPLFGDISKSRKYVGENWNKKYLRGIQCILIATHGVVGPKRSFFEKAFGKNANEFKKIILMPENYIIYRNTYKENGALTWEKDLKSLSSSEYNRVLSIIKENDFRNIKTNIRNRKIIKVLQHYSNSTIS